MSRCWKFRVQTESKGSLEEAKHQKKDMRVHPLSLKLALGLDGGCCLK